MLSRTTSFVAFAAALLVGCAGTNSNKMPDERDFFLEVLDPMPRSTSGSFHSYSDDSYFVNKVNFWSEFPKFARQEGYDARAVLVVGPVGMMWTYYIFAFLEEEDGIRINEVVFPHGRLTAKQTIVLTEEEAFAWLSKVESIEGVQAISATPEAFRAEHYSNDMGDFEFNLLLVRIDETQEAFFADIPWVIEEESGETGSSAIQQLEDSINELVSKMEQTY